MHEIVEVLQDGDRRVHPDSGQQGEAPAIARFLWWLGGIETVHRVRGSYDLTARLKTQPTRRDPRPCRAFRGVVHAVGS
jgi:hypothetical protein